MNLKPLSKDVLCEYKTDRVILTYPPRILNHRHPNGYQHYFHDYQKTIPLLRKASHPNLVKILDFKVKNDYVTIAYERLHDYWPMRFFMEKFLKIYNVQQEDKDYLVNNIVQTFNSWKQHTAKIIQDAQSVSDFLEAFGLVHGDMALNNLMWNRNTLQCKISDLKTVKSIEYYRQYNMFSSSTFKQSILDTNLNVKSDWIIHTGSPWR